MKDKISIDKDVQIMNRKRGLDEKGEARGTEGRWSGKGVVY